MNRVIRMNRQFSNNAHFHGDSDKTCHMNPDLVLTVIIVCYVEEGFAKTNERFLGAGSSRRPFY